MMTFLGVAILIFQIWALIDILKNEFTGYNKIIWLLAVIFLPLAGTILYYFIYYFIGKEQRAVLNRE
jgi:hypothetical protein